jgi:cytosine/adenosine deaminase-related metal-dependent hydrolase
MGRAPAQVFREKESKDMTEGIHLDENPMEALTSRRKFLAGSAAALAGGALMTVPGVAKAHTTPEPPTGIDILN